MAINNRRVWIGAIAGGVVWGIWTTIVNVVILAERYKAAQDAGQLLKEPRYPYFPIVWYLGIFAVSYVLAWLYASVRATQGPGPATAFKVGALVGFAAGFPINFSATSWATFERSIPLWWTLDMWVGAILAALVAGWLYRE